MEKLVTLLLSHIQDAPIYFVITIGFIVLVFAMYLKVRSVNVSEITSISTMQTNQVKMLLDEIRQLSTDLTAARLQITTMTTKVDELENLVREYKVKCDECQYKKKP